MKFKWWATVESRNPLGGSGGSSSFTASNEQSYLEWYDEMMSDLHREGLTLSFDSYSKIIEMYPVLYESLPNNIKCQELELVSRL